MAEVSKIQGPSGSPDPSKKEKSVSDDKFKKMMKVEKVREVDPEEQKKRKRREEVEEETESAEEPIAPPPQATGDSIFKAGKGTSPISPKEGTGEAPPKAPSPYIPEAPRTEESRTSEEEPAPPPSKSYEPSAPRERVRPSTPEEREAAKEKEKVKKAETPLKKEEEKKIVPPTVTPEEKVVAEKPLTPEEKEVLLSKQVQEKEEEKKEDDTEAVSEAAATLGAPTSKEVGGKKEEEEKKIEEPTAAMTGQKEGLITPPPDLASVIPTTTPSYAYLHPQVLDMFERMVGVMTVMTTTGMTETTVTLNAPQYATSAFFGAQISIQEFSTAPKLFNVQILTPPQGVALINANANELMAAFQSGNYNFKINRIETGLLGVDKPLFRRKEQTREKGEKEQEGK